MTFKVVKRERPFDCADIFEPFRCLQCINFKTCKLVDLKRHFGANHSRQELQENRHDCKNCNFKTLSRFLLLVHQSKLCSDNAQPELPISSVEKKNKGKKLLKCDRCSYTAKRPSILKLHVLRKHTDPDKIQWFKCGHCLHKSKTKAGIKDHIANIHGNNKPIKCDQCSFATKRKRNLKRHFIAKHADPEEKGKSFKCDFCPLTARWPSSLKSHVLRRHTDPEKIEWFKCAQCPFKSKVKFDLNRHITHTHQNESYREKFKNWFKCEQCTYKGRTDIKLKFHMKRRHTNIKIVPKDRQLAELKWFECQKCTYKTVIEYELYAHGVRIHGEPKS